MTATLKRLLSSHKLEMLHARKNTLFNLLPDAPDFRLARIELFDLLTKIERTKQGEFPESTAMNLGISTVA